MTIEKGRKPEWWPFDELYAMMDCIEGMKRLPSDCVDTVITDPPYGIEFMGAEWDAFKDGKNIAGGSTGEGTPFGRSKALPAFFQLGVAEKLAFYNFSVAWTQEAFRITKPGGHIFAFGGTRMFHWLACALEMTGWQYRDTIMWVYGTGFPKSHDLAKAIDKTFGAEVVEWKSEPMEKATAVGEISPNRRCSVCGKPYQSADPCLCDRSYKPVTPSAQEWNGWGTALKPAWEPILVAMKPLDGTYAENALKHGVAGLNIKDCVVGDEVFSAKANKASVGGTWNKETCGLRKDWVSAEHAGRFPANLIHDGSDEVVALFPEANSGHWSNTKVTGFGEFGGGKTEYMGVGRKDNTGGSVARFFYCAKPTKDEKTPDGEASNIHPTVKPLELMKYLCRITKTPTGGVVLDPFLGSGTTIEACHEVGRVGVGFEKTPEYEAIIRGRVYRNQKRIDFFGGGDDGEG